MTREELNELSDKDLSIVALREILISGVADGENGFSGINGDNFIEACAKLHSIGNLHRATRPSRD